MSGELPFFQQTAGCFAEATGGAGLDPDVFARILARTGAALAGLREAHADGSLPLLRLPAAREDLVVPGELAARWRRDLDVVCVLGTGGSSLGGEAVAAFRAPDDDGPELRFLDNIDPDSFDPAVTAVDAGRMGFLIVSKSGTTAETLAQTAICIDRTTRRLGGDKLAGQFAAIAGPGDNPLRALAARHGFPVIDHDPDLGGRYAVLSPVGMLPAMLAGVDPLAVRAGAAAVLDPVLAGGDPASLPPAVGAALNVAFAAAPHGYRQTVLLAYSDRLGRFGAWWRQLWAESLGKDGHGTTPVPATGVVDQHSQLQLWLAGPRDALFTLVLVDRAGSGGVIDPATGPGAFAHPALAPLAGRTMGDLMAAEQRATTDTLLRNGRPVRILRLPRLDAGALGAMMMHFMLETIIAGRLGGVDPFDQPAVEEGKVLARRYLGDMEKDDGTTP